MLSAHSKGKEVVTLLNLTREQIEKLKEKKHFCPICNHPVVIKNGRIKIPHFAHGDKAQCQFNSEGETLEHLTLKSVFANWCEKESIKYDLEKYLPEINQRPDLLIGNIALEIQCSPLSIKRLAERTKSYHDQGFTPIWLCGKKIFSDQRTLGEVAKNLCYYSRTIGFYLWGVDWEKEELAIYFHIEEDWKRQLYFIKKTWGFYEDFLIEILKFPEKSQVCAQRKFEIGGLTTPYYLDLNRKLARRDERTRLLQSILYNNHFHLLELPGWFYYPGIPLFCCHGSDIPFKMKIWNLVQFFDQNVFSTFELEELIKNEIINAPELFYELPNIAMKDLQFYCLNQLLISLIENNHVVRVPNGWKMVQGKENQRMADLNIWFKSLENKCLISAIPVRNVIR